MKELTKLLIFLLLFCSAAYAQKIYFCQSHTENGDPIGAEIIWEINPWGSYVYILFENGEEAIGESMIYMFIDKFEDESYKPFDSKAIHSTYR